MSTESNHPMDKRLRETARARGNVPGAPSSLHPATRRAQQAEVKQIYGSRTPPESSSMPGVRLGWWFRWPGLIAIGSCVVLIGLSVVLWPSLSPHHDYELAKLDFSTPADTSRATPPAAVMPATPSPARIEPVVSSSPPAAPSFAAAKEHNLALDRSASESAPALYLNFRRVEPEMTHSAPTLAISPTATDRARSVSAAPDTRLLAQFQLNLQNGQVQIIDQDGSTYVGALKSVVLPESSMPQKAAIRDALPSRAKARSNASPDQIAGASSFSFQAVGTNRSSQQAVRLDGELRQNTGSAIASSLSQTQLSSGAAGVSRRAFQSSPPALPPSWELRSTVNLGGRSQQLNAIEIPTNAPTFKQDQSPR